MSMDTTQPGASPLYVSDILSSLNQLAPLSWIKNVGPGDNVGLLAGSGWTPVTGILCALDISLETIREAVSVGAQLLVSHHPLTFGLTSVTDRTAAGRHVLSLAQCGLSAICLHTNWDAAPFGVNDALATAVGLKPPFEFLDGSYLHTDGRTYGMGRIGTLPSALSARDLALSVKAALGCTGVRLVAGSRPITRVAVCSGSGGSLWDAAVKSGCDAYITGDIKHHMFLEAATMDMTLIDAGHFATENISIPRLVNYLRETHPLVSVHLSQVTTEPAEWL